MKIWILLCFIILGCSKSFNVNHENTDTLGVEQKTVHNVQVKFDSDLEKVSYSIGFLTGKSISERFPELDPELISEGCRQGQLTTLDSSNAEELDKAVSRYRSALHYRKQYAKKEVIIQNKAIGNLFLERNKTKEGVKCLKSGLQYRVLCKGMGRKPSGIQDGVKFEFVVKDIYGKIIDNSGMQYKHGFMRILDTIDGLAEAFLHMEAGAEWEVYIPSHLAYGLDGYGEVEPAQVLVAYVKVLEFKKLPARRKRHHDNFERIWTMYKEKVDSAAIRMRKH